MILGGGPAGCSTALALQQQGITQILVVEAGHYQTIRIGESLPPDTRLLLEQLGLLSDFLQESHEPCLGSCACWGSDKLGYNDFLFNPSGHGWHLDRNRFDRFLAKQVVERGITLDPGWRFQTCKSSALGFRLGFQKQNETGSKGVDVAHDRQTRIVDSRFVIDATGRGTYFARCQGAKRLLHDRLVCAIAFFDLPHPTSFSQLTMLEAVEYGWWYAAKLPNNRLVVAVASEPDLIQQWGLAQKKQWLKQFKATQHLAPALGHQPLATNRLTTDLIVCAAPSFLLDQVGGGGWLAVGDAASAYDPIASQGVYKALSNGLAGAQVVAADFQNAPSMLADYQTLITNQFQDYLQNRNYFYAMEQRWPDSSFWKKRLARKMLRQ
ncbi:flavin-dependent dehydrogenase [Leptolyngbya sp. PCC 7375]|nr:flavin-dependent dehydrogenase [Leptolyngbya sp. PCC 7375]